MISLVTQEHFPLVKLFPDVVYISFRHRKEISRIFNDVLGLHDIDHISIDIIDTDNTLVYFSTTPSMGYNLITGNLWPYDGSISPTYFGSYPFYYWDQTYHQKYFHHIKKIKETDYGFAFGFTLVRKIAGFHILYSFATRNNDPEKKLLFLSNTSDLLKIGDFCYKSIRDIYACYCDPKSPPIMNSPILLTKNTHNAANLRLVVNNPR